ncbi:MAG: phage shock protein operon transcriptional activator [Desulfobulbaceae bacterium]|nr:phage shock protein operon transcriptional activator [Desulfobulbaceae bacterium]
MVKTNDALGQSEPFLDFQERLSLVAPVDRPVLLMGERGTGKELAANRLHFLSKRWQGPFVTLNCATLSPTLIESELFGHDKGAFTGADRRKIGRFEVADGGTLFLDEIGSIPLEAQEKILRVVEYSSFERVGSSSPIEVDVRIVGATNEDLLTMAELGRFKRDLLDRLSFEVLFLPPLRYRGEDIMLLANHFASRMSFELNREVDVSFTRAAVKSLEEYHWMGNVRELKNVVERAVYRSEAGEISEIIFDPFVSPYENLNPVALPDTATPEQNIRQKEKPEVTSTTQLSFKEATRQFEISILREVLLVHRHNQKKAASSLGLSYDQFRGKLRKYATELLY